jgi:hypothetical protein
MVYKGADCIHVPCEKGNDYVGCLKGGKFIDQRSNYYLGNINFEWQSKFEFHPITF